MWIIENISLIMIKNYYPCVHYFPCRKFHVCTAAKPLYKSQQPEHDMAKNIQCSEVYKLYNDHPFDKPITTGHAKKWQKTDVHHGLSQKSGVQNIHTKFYKINEDQLDPTLLPPVS